MKISGEIWKLGDVWLEDFLFKLKLSFLLLHFKKKQIKNEY